MIGSIRGTVIGSVRGALIVEVNNVGYRAWVLASTLASTKEGDERMFWTHLAVRETAQDLYGFESRDELTWFELLISVSGVGPKSALAIMNSVDTTTLEQAITRGDAGSLSKGFGVGKKTAEKIVLELREKVGGLEDKTVKLSGSDGDVIDALVGLGYSAREARDAVRAVAPTTTSTEDRIREAIRIASRSM